MKLLMALYQKLQSFLSNRAHLPINSLIAATEDVTQMVLLTCPFACSVLEVSICLRLT